MRCYTVYGLTENLSHEEADPDEVNTSIKPFPTHPSKERKHSHQDREVEALTLVDVEEWIVLCS